MVIRMLMWIGMHATEIVMVLGIATPCVWWVVAAVTEDWRWARRHRKEAERWDAVGRFFADHYDQYPEAADAFFTAGRWHSFSQGAGW